MTGKEQGNVGASQVYQILQISHKVYIKCFIWKMTYINLICRGFDDSNGEGEKEGKATR